MRILLVNPAVGYYTRALSNPLGLLSIGTYLQSCGHTVRIIDRCIGDGRLEKELRTFRPELAGVSVMSGRGVKDARKVSHMLKKAGCPVVWGGQLPSLQPEIALQCPDVDLLSIGEGEFTFAELAEHFAGSRTLDSVAGIAYREGEKIHFTPCRPFADLAALPRIDWSLVDTKQYMQRYFGCQKALYIYSAKGCPCHCAFCSNVNFHKSTYRKRPNALVLDEIEDLIAHYGLDGVYFSDELWCMRRAEMEEFCAMVKARGLQFHWGIQARVGQFTEDDFRRMYDAGCRWVFLGIETGSREMMRRVHKNIDYDKIVPTFEALRRVGITSVGSFIVGFPGETREMLRDTAQLILRTKADLTPVYHFTPLPGTELYEQVCASGEYRRPETLRDVQKVIATEHVGQNLSAVPTRELRVLRSWFHWQSFTRKDAMRSGKKFEFARQTILDGLHSISRNGPLLFLANGFQALFEFLYVFWYAHAYPSIRKTYGLHR